MNWSEQDLRCIKCYYVPLGMGNNSIFSISLGRWECESRLEDRCNCRTCSEVVAA